MLLGYKTPQFLARIGIGSNVRVPVDRAQGSIVRAVEDNHAGCATIVHLKFDLAPEKRIP